VSEATKNLALKLILYPVTDAAKAKTFYNALLGTEPYADSPYYIGYRIGEQEIGLVPNGQKNGIPMPHGYCDVDDIKQSIKTLVDAGATLHQDVRDVGGGLLVALLKDPDGNITGLRQGKSN